MKAATLRSCICILAILACAQLPLLADGPQTGTIDGRVLDAQGQPLPGATVTLAGPQKTSTALTDAEGHYRFALLINGSFVVSTEIEGLGKNEVAITLEPGQRRGVDLTLREGAAERITVRSEAPMISKYETAATSTLDAEVAESIAFGSRNYVESLAALPGAVLNDGLTGFSGGRHNDTSTFIEGVDISNTRRGGEFWTNIPTTAVAQTSYQTAGVGAEYGRGQTGVINTVIKSGTNQFHGELLYVGQNFSWREPYANSPDLPREDKMINSFEASLGGPIIPDSGWFFVAHANTSTNRLDLTRGGDTFNSSQEADAIIAKLNFQPDRRHQIALTDIRAPKDALSANGGAADLFSLTHTRRDSKVLTLAWDFAISPTVFLELKGASSEDTLRRSASQRREIDPDASPDSPLGNNFRYRDLNTGSRYNGTAVRFGDGLNSFPRDQLNAAVTMFRDNHELRAGADRHLMEFDIIVDIDTEYRGRGYNENLPGGFARPIDKRVYVPAPGGVTHVESQLATVYAQDRIDIRDRWVLTFGLRLEDQAVDNNVGVEVNDYTELAPRLTAVYDVNADGSLLLRATAGRYYRGFNLSLSFDNFTEGANGENQYDQFRWNAGSGLYDRFQRFVDRTTSHEAQRDLEPDFMDSFSVGVDWQLSRNWVGKARIDHTESRDMWWASTQFDADGQIVFDLRNWNAGEAASASLGAPSPGRGFREHTGLVLQLSRAFRNNWTVHTNLTLNDTAGNVQSTSNNDVTFDGLGGIEVGTGATDATSRFTRGRLNIFNNRAHILNIIGIKRWQIGKHALNTGVYFNWLAGRYWGFSAITTIFHPQSLEELRVSTLLEPRDASQLPDNKTLNLNLSWVFPIRGVLEGQLGFEVANATNEDVQTGVNSRTGLPVNVVGAFQRPREFRLNAGFRF